MHLIVEDVLDTQFVKEDRDGKQSMYIQGIYAQAEVANKNKRFYPLPVLESEVRRYTNENIRGGRAWGECGHPAGPNINLDRACILIKEMNQSGKDFHGKALVTSTPMGQVIRGLIEDGGKLGVSTRALGSLKPRHDGINEVQNDLRLLAVDVVADPSAPSAFVNGIMEERSYFWDAARQAFIEENADNVRKSIRSMSIAEIEEKQTRMFADFLNKLGDFYQS